MFSYQKRNEEFFSSSYSESEEEEEQVKDFLSPIFKKYKKIKEQ
jgi:hypothetical protein